MDIKQKFIELTSKTYPHGTEQELFSLLPDILSEDEFGNLFVKIGESRCMFTSHLDTASRKQDTVVHVEKGEIIMTDKKTILGADDKAGVVVMLNMIENNISGLYYFFLGEERGCIGSSKVAEKHKKNPLEIDKVISFDRRGTNSIITHQSGLRCCSENFANSLASELNLIQNKFSYKTDNTGILTDSLEFISIYPECTNISVGYYDEHTVDERQDIEHLKRLCDACLNVKWERLPVERETKPYSEEDYFEEEIVDTYETWSTDNNGNLCSFITDINGFVIKASLNEDRKKLERKLLKEFLKSIELDIKSYEWNGARLKVKYKEGHSSICRRDELYPYIKDLDFREW